MHISATDVIPASIASEHDTPFTCINVRNNFRKEAHQTGGRQKQVEGSYSSGLRDLHKAGVIL